VNNKCLISNIYKYEETPQGNDFVSVFTLEERRHAVFFLKKGQIFLR
jgi:hypothetical protein